jgi:hypothetical protein
MRTLLRMFGLVLLAAAVVAAVIDGTRSIADSAVLITPLEQSWRDVSPPSLEAAQAFVVRQAGEAAWTSVAAPLLRLPTAAVCAALALVFLFLGRARRDLLS